jgi:hypothetical protein
MTVFRHKITKILYLIHYCIPRMILGRHFEATPYPNPDSNGGIKKHIKIEDFEPIGER